MKKINIISIILIGLCLSIFSCKEEKDIKIKAPEVKFDIPAMGYTTYINESIDIKATVNSIGTTKHSWIEDNEEISKDATLHYSSEKPAIHIIKYIASNDGGKTETTINIEVVDIKVPKVEIIIPEEGFSVKQTEELTIEATVESIKECTYSWKEGEKELSTEKALKFISKEKGVHTIIFIAKNAGGKTEKTITINVIPINTPIVDIKIPEGGFSVKQSEEINIKAEVESDKDCKYSWKEGDKELSTNKTLSFATKKLGKHTLIFSAENIGGKTEKIINIEVLPFKKPIININIPEEGFIVKRTKELIITPIVVSEKDCIYSWKEGKKVHSTGSTLKFIAKELGKHTLIFSAENIGGKTEKTIDIKVIAFDTPEINIIIPEGGFCVEKTKELIIEAQVTSIKKCKFSWKEDNKELSTDEILKFSTDKLGKHTLIFSAENSEIKTEKTITINVVPIDAPQIIINIPKGGFTVKQTDELSIEAKVKTTKECKYSWKENNKELSTSKILKFSSEIKGTHTLTFSAEHSGNKTEKTIIIKVTPFDKPTINIITTEGGFSVKQTKTIRIEAEVQSTKKCIYSWKENNKELSTDKIIEFSSTKIGKHTLIFSAENIGGKTEQTIIIEVISIPKAKISFPNNKTNFSLRNGETIDLRPIVETDGETTYLWTLNGITLADTKDFAYTASKNGLSKLTFKATNIGGESTVEIQLLIGLKTRPSNSSNSVTKVFDFTPAPGQFINEGYHCDTMEEAKEMANKNLNNKDYYLSLGGFGGYVVMGFDHSIVDNEGQDIMIKGNSFNGSSEPGIVWVMQDENNNGKPDDTWYQLKGSEYEKPETIQNYSITYTRPSEPRQDVRWVDNQGGSGCIDCLKYHKQDYYYPDWIKEDSYTLSGPRLKGRVTVKNGIYKNNVFDWGYVDNKDHITDGNLFEFKNAVDKDGKAIELGFIDFIKVQNAVNEKAGWIGENSTEIYYVEDIK
jgi:hypothetical protein